VGSAVQTSQPCKVGAALTGNKGGSRRRKRKRCERTECWRIKEREGEVEVAVMKLTISSGAWGEDWWAAMVCQKVQGNAASIMRVSY
jgi:hypothetical protein